MSDSAGAQRRWVPGFEGYYIVTSAGQVFSYLNGRHGLTDQPRELKQTLTSGYPTVSLFGTRYRVHRLVLEAFAGPAPEGMLVAHYNGIRTDNRLENLRWATPAENARDAVRHGTISRGSHRPLAKLTEEQAVEIHRRWQAGETCTALAQEFGVSKSSALRIGRGQAWRHALDAA